MKKILLLLLVLLFGCEKTEKPEFTYEVTAKNVDMSGYAGITSTKHCFREIHVNEFFNVVDQGSSGIFFLGTTMCGCCQNVTRYLNEVALDLGVTIYYIDAYSEENEITDNVEVKNKLFDYMYDILGYDEDGNKAFLTPHLFTVINGKLSGSQICADGVAFDAQPSQKQIEKLKNVYKRILKPFVE